MFDPTQALCFKENDDDRKDRIIEEQGKLVDRLFTEIRNLEAQRNALQRTIMRRIKKS